MKCPTDPMDEFDNSIQAGGQFLDQFEIDLDFCLTDYKSSRSRDDDESSEELADRQPGKRMKLRLPKHDIRRYYSNMFLNVINSANFDYILPYFGNFMNPTGKFVLEYVAPKLPKVRALNMVSEGPQPTAYYLMGLSTMFPDMSIVATSGQVVTSNAWAGCKLVLETTFNYTKIYDVSFEKALAQLSLAYQPYKHRRMLEEARAQRTAFQTDCEAARLTLTSHSSSFISTSSNTSGECDTVSVTDSAITQVQSINTQSISTSSSSDAMDVVSGPELAPHMILTSKIQQIFSSQSLLPEPLHISARCRFVIVLDERNHINQITVSAVQDHVNTVTHSLHSNAI